MSSSVEFPASLSDAQLANLLVQTPECLDLDQGFTALIDEAAKRLAGRDTGAASEPDAPPVDEASEPVVQEAGAPLSCMAVRICRLEDALKDRVGVDMSEFPPPPQRLDQRIAQLEWFVTCDLARKDDLNFAHQHIQNLQRAVTLLFGRLS